MPLAVLFLILLCIVVGPAMAQQLEPIAFGDTVSVAEWRETLHPGGDDPSAELALVLTHPDQEAARIATVTYSETYGDMDIYYPSGYEFSDPIATVIILSAFSDREVMGFAGTGFRAMRKMVDYASLCAAHGMAAVLCDTGSPLFSNKEALNFLYSNARDLHIDTSRLGFLSVAWQAEMALGMLSKQDVPAMEGVAAMAMLYPGTGAFSRPVGNPAFYIVIAGRDMRDMVQNVKRAADRLEGWGYPVTVVEFANAASNFDHLLDTDESRAFIQGAIDFLAAELTD
jgi:hypothetical protein